MTGVRAGADSTLTPSLDAQRTNTAEETNVHKSTPPGKGDRSRLTCLHPSLSLHTRTRTDSVSTTLQLLKMVPCNRPLWSTY